MRIVLANQWFPPETGCGGVATYNHAVAHAMRTLGHTVTVITSRLTPNSPPQVELDGIWVHRLLIRDMPRLRRSPLIGRYVRPMQQLAYSHMVADAIRHVHAARPVDVVEFAEVNAEGFFYARAPQTPFIVRCHTPTFVLSRYHTQREMPFDTRLIGWCEKDAIRRAHALTAPSQNMAQVIAHECCIAEHAISVIPNALPVDAAEAPEMIEAGAGVTVLHVGRLDRAKGVEVLAHAIALVVHQVPGVRFVFIGADRPTVRGTSQRAELERILAQAGVGSSVEFLGRVDQAVLDAWYLGADICAVPSVLYESFSYTCAQAMAAGKPVVASRIGGIPETVDDGVSGLLVAPGDSQELGSAIVRLANDAELRRQMGEAGRKKAAACFDPLAVARQNLAVYEDARRRFRSSAKA